MHPSVHGLGIFDEEILPWDGATQGYHCTQFLESGIKVEDVWASPGIFTMRFPVLGPEFAQVAAHYRNMGVFGGWVSGDDSKGRIRLLPGGLPDFQYDVGAADARRLQHVTALIAEIFFAAGARRVIAKLGGHSPDLRSAADVKYLREPLISQKDFAVASNHVFGTMAMGGSPDTSATDSSGAVWDASDLYVADTSLFPSSPGVNPMHTAMALAHRLSEELLARY
jgi:hypothetical protein